MDFFIIKDEDMRTSSEIFFGFFTNLIWNVHKSMPKIDEKKLVNKKSKSIKEKRK